MKLVAPPHAALLAPGQVTSFSVTCTRSVVVGLSPQKQTLGGGRVKRRSMRAGTKGASRETAAHLLRRPAIA